MDTKQLIAGAVPRAEDAGLREVIWAAPSTARTTRRMIEIGVRPLEPGEQSVRRKCTGANNGGCAENYLALTDEHASAYECRVCGACFWLTAGRR